METYLSIAEMAAHIKLSEQTIRRYVLNREIPYHKIKKVVRFRLSEIERWIDEGARACSVESDDDLEGDLFAGVECCPPAADSLGVCEANSSKAGGTGADGQSGETCCPPAADSLGVCSANSRKERV